MDIRNIHKKITDTFLREYGDRKTLWCYLKNGNSKGSNFDPYRNTGYTETVSNPEPVMSYVRQLSPSSLIAREIGMIHTGAREVVIDAQDLGCVLNSQKIVYEDNEYTVYTKATGTKVQIYDLPFNMKKVIMFRRYS